MASTPSFFLYLITDRLLAGGWDPLFVALERALEGGADGVQLREKDVSAAELYPRARELRELTRRFGAKLLINDRVDVALAVGADGVHLGGHSLPAAVVRHKFGDDVLIGVSTHRVPEVVAAQEAGADFVTFGPVYPTPGKAAYGPAVGVKSLGEVCRTSTLPVYALGGVTPDRCAEVLSAGGAGCATISAVLEAEDPGEVVGRFVERRA